ncbi:MULTISPECIES: hypothetical protein [Streptococcus]|uniref:hypothetical protein n=1 Tax=Streptococcus TaxID=1301 RepID=UPI001106712A|nr:MULTISPECIES: hypothetical protein [Streptococcus]
MTDKLVRILFLTLFFLGLTLLSLAQKYLYKTITAVSIFARGICLLALLVTTVFHIFIKMM